MFQHVRWRVWFVCCCLVLKWIFVAREKWKKKPKRQILHRYRKSGVESDPPASFDFIHGVFIIFSPDCFDKFFVSVKHARTHHPETEKSSKNRTKAKFPKSSKTKQTSMIDQFDPIPNNIHFQLKVKPTQTPILNTVHPLDCNTNCLIKMICCCFFKLFNIWNFCVLFEQIP